MNSISVIIPAYRAQPYLCRCLNSVLAQTLKDFDVLLTDDGSPDQTGEISDEYALENACLTVLHQPNGGLSSARNSALDLAFARGCGRWITFVDSDDRIMPDYLKALRNAAEENGTLLAVGGYRICENGQDLPMPDAAFVTRVLKPDDLYGREICEELHTSPIIACDKLYDKSLLRDERFPVGKLYEDRFTTHKLLFMCDRIACTGQILYDYFMNPGSIMHMTWRPQMLAEFDAAEEQLRFFRARGAKKAYRSTIADYANALTRQILVMREMNMDENGCEKLLLYRLRMLLLRHAVPDRISIRKNCDAYKVAFPCLTALVLGARDVVRGEEA